MYTDCIPNHKNTCCSSHIHLSWIYKNYISWKNSACDWKFAGWPEMKEESFKQVILSTTFCEVLHFSESPQMREFHLTNSRWWMSFRDGILLQTPILFNDMQISNIGEACIFILILMKINRIEIPVCPFN